MSVSAQKLRAADKLWMSVSGKLPMTVRKIICASHECTFDGRMLRTHVTKALLLMPFSCFLSPDLQHHTSPKGYCWRPFLVFSRQIYNTTRHQMVTADTIFLFSLARWRAPLTGVILIWLPLVFFFSPYEGTTEDGRKLDFIISVELMNDSMGDR